MENFVYLVGDEKTREVLMVDPAWEVDRVLKIAEEEDLKVKGALITHHHYDHVNGLDDLLNKTNGVAYLQKAEESYLKGFSGNLQLVDGGDKIKIGKIEITFVHTPGHTPGSQCFLVGNGLIAGDTLFIGACGRCDLPGGDAAQMYESLNQLSKLDKNTVLYPGHNYADRPTSTIGDEKETNPYMMQANMKNFVKYRTGK